MGISGTIISAAVASWARSSVKGKEPETPYQEDEMSRRPLLSLALPPKASLGSPPQLPTYGSTSQEGRVSARSSPERYRRESQLGPVVEEDAVEDSDEEQWDLEERGYYIGTWVRLVQDT